MTAPAALAAGRRAAERLMIDRCTASRVQHATTQEGLDSYEQVTVWTGPCKVQTYEPYETAKTVGGAPLVEQRYVLHLPVGAGPFEVGDVFTIEGRARPLRVTGLHEKTMQTAQRLACEEVATDAR